MPQETEAIEGQPGSYRVSPPSDFGDAYEVIGPDGVTVDSFTYKNQADQLAAQLNQAVALERELQAKRRKVWTDVELGNIFNAAYEEQERRFVHPYSSGFAAIAAKLNEVSNA